MATNVFFDWESAIKNAGISDDDYQDYKRAVGIRGRSNFLHEPIPPGILEKIAILEAEYPSINEIVRRQVASIAATRNEREG